MLRAQTLAILAAMFSVPATAQEAGPIAGPRGAAPDAVTASAGRPPAGPQGWVLSFGLAPVFGSAWQGSRDTAVSIFPDLRLNYNDTIFASVPEGIGWNAVNTDGWRAGPVIKARFGRKENNGGSPFQIAGGSDDLRGMGDIGVGGEVGGFIEKRFGPNNRLRGRIEVRQGFGAHQAVVGDVSLAVQGRSGRMIYSVGPRATVASGDFMQTYFGVDAVQAQRTGLAISRPDGGLVSYGVGGALIRPLDRRRSVTLFGGVDRLGGEPAGTSLIRERGQRMQFTVALGYAMRFGL